MAEFCVTRERPCATRLRVIRMPAHANDLELTRRARLGMCRCQRQRVRGQRQRPRGTQRMLHEIAAGKANSLHGGLIPRGKSLLLSLND